MMKRLIFIVFMTLMSLNVFATTSDWSVDVDAGTYLMTTGSKPYFNVEAIYEQGFFRVGGEADVKVKDWGIDEAGIFGKASIFGKFANIYGEIGIGIGFVTDTQYVDLKYKPEAKLLIDMGDYVIETKLGILIKDEFNKDNAYLSIGVQKRFYKELE